MTGHFRFFKLVINLVDGKLRQTIDEELVFEPDRLLVVPDGVLGAELTPAAA
jgi:hypothetical protein